jgi:hypothetical protein
VPLDLLLFPLASVLVTVVPGADGVFPLEVGGGETGLVSRRLR